MAAATDYFVSNTADSGNGSLRQALLDAEASAGADRILFNDNLGTITITGGMLPLITQDLILNGGSGNTVSGGGAQRVFFVESGNVAINQLTIADGYAKGGNGGTDGAGGGGAGLGGGLFIDQGHVTLSGVQFNDNQAVGGDGAVLLNTQSSGGGGMGGNGGYGLHVFSGGGGVVAWEAVVMAAMHLGTSAPAARSLEGTAAAAG